jgi:hypothetical protein
VTVGRRRRRRLVGCKTSRGADAIKHFARHCSNIPLYCTSSRGEQGLLPNTHARWWRWRTLRQLKNWLCTASWVRLLGIWHLASLRQAAETYSGTGCFKKCFSVSKRFHFSPVYFPVLSSLPAPFLPTSFCPLTLVSIRAELRAALKSAVAFTHAQP